MFLRGLSAQEAEAVVNINSSVLQQASPRLQERFSKDQLQPPSTDIQPGSKTGCQQRTVIN
ncbi:MAG: hypothetical protein C0508_07465 [Cyanobacteria bacterium PR.023]|nr:hypothetical protein [Cyanobacteria bacterium PR.023]